jgi:hypothetical protein
MTPRHHTELARIGTGCAAVHDIVIFMVSST